MLDYCPCRKYIMRKREPEKILKPELGEFVEIFGVLSFLMLEGERIEK